MLDKQKIETGKNILKQSKEHQTQRNFEPPIERLREEEQHRLRKRIKRVSLPKTSDTSPDYQQGKNTEDGKDIARQDITPRRRRINHKGGSTRSHLKQKVQQVSRWR